jgi:hypothetical protein
MTVDLNRVRQFYQQVKFCCEMLQGLVDLSRTQIWNQVAVRLAFGESPFDPDKDDDDATQSTGVWLGTLGVANEILCDLREANKSYDKQDYADVWLLITDAIARLPAELDFDEVQPSPVATRVMALIRDILSEFTIWDDSLNMANGHLAFATSYFAHVEAFLDVLRGWSCDPLESYESPSEVIPKLIENMRQEFRVVQEYLKRSALKRRGGSVDRVPSYTPADLNVMLDCQERTLSRYADKARCKKPERGGRDFRYEGENLLQLLRWLRDTADSISSTSRAAAKLELERIQTDIQSDKPTNETDKPTS